MPQVGNPCSRASTSKLCRLAVYKLETTISWKQSPSGKCAKLHTAAASNNRVHVSKSLYYCLFAPHIYMGVVFRAHPVRGESHIQRNANREVATTSPFYSEQHRSHFLCVKSAPGTTFTSRSQHSFVTIGKPERQVRKVSHFGSKQQ